MVETTINHALLRGFYYLWHNLFYGCCEIYLRCGDGVYPRAYSVNNRFLQNRRHFRFFLYNNRQAHVSWIISNCFDSARGFYFQVERRLRN